MKAIKINDEYELFELVGEGSINHLTNEITKLDSLCRLIFSYGSAIYSSYVSDDSEVTIENSTVLCEVKNGKCYISGVKVDVDLYNKAITIPGLIPILKYTDNSSCAANAQLNKDMGFYMNILGVHLISSKKSYGGIDSKTYSHEMNDEYRITLHVQSKSASSGIFRDTAIATKLISTTTKVNLDKYRLVENVDFFDDKIHTRYLWNYELMFEDHPEFKNKLDNVNLQLIKESVVLYAPVKLNINEFDEDDWLELGHLEVDENTSFYGNYNINGKSCCEIAIIKRDEIGSPVEKMINDLDDIGDKISFKEQELKILEMIKLFKQESIEGKPYEVHLSGNDDDSWSCGFWTLEEAKKEASYLKSIQPINKARHVIGRGYYFSN